MGKKPRKKRQSEYTFICRNAREEQAIAGFCVPFQHYLRKELAKKRKFDFTDIAINVAEILQNDFPENCIVPLK